MRSFRRDAWSFVCAALYASAALAADVSTERDRNWFEWRGPLGTGVAPHANPPLEWSETKNVRWKIEIPGRGTASPIVWNDQVFLLTAIDTGRVGDAPPFEAPPGDRFGIQYSPNIHQFVVLCLDRGTGAIRWQRVATEAVPHEGYHPDHGYASSSPVTDGKHVYASFGSRGLYCYDMAGNLVWQRDLGRMITKLSFGEGSSPALFEDRVVVVADHEDGSFIECLDALTGKTIWKAARDEGTNWSTPRIVEHAGRRQVVVNGSTRARGYDLATGEVLWECGGQSDNAIPSPVVADGLAYCMSGYRSFLAVAVPLDSTGDVTESDGVAWRQSEGTPYIPSPVLVNNRLYFTEANRGILTCVDAKTGETLLGQTRLPSMDTLYASPVSAAGRIYFVARTGATLVIKESPTFEVLAVNQLDDPIDATPAIADGELFLRGEKHLYCIAE